MLCEAASGSRWRGALERMLVISASRVEHWGEATDSARSPGPKETAGALWIINKRYFVDTSVTFSVDPPAIPPRA